MWYLDVCRDLISHKHYAVLEKTIFPAVKYNYRVAIHNHAQYKVTYYIIMRVKQIGLSHDAHDSSHVHSLKIQTAFIYFEALVLTKNLLFVFKVCKSMVIRVKLLFF